MEGILNYVLKFPSLEKAWVIFLNSDTVYGFVQEGIGNVLPIWTSIDKAKEYLCSGEDDPMDFVFLRKDIADIIASATLISIDVIILDCPNEGTEYEEQLCLRISPEA